MRASRFVRAAVVLAALGGCERAAPAPTGPARVLVFSKTAGYRHESIDSGKVALMRLGAANGMQVDTTEDAANITLVTPFRFIARRMEFRLLAGRITGASRPAENAEARLVNLILTK